MPTVELRFSALPAHVRTARLVAVAMARKAGLDEEVLDEVRLAVGEACSRAVELHQQHQPQEAVLLQLSDDDNAFSVTVVDHAPSGASLGQPADAVPDLTGAGAAAAPAAQAAPLSATADLPDDVGLAVISGLVEQVDVDSDDSGGRVRMSWPAGLAS
ncbi:MAG: ATP-binding protein [Actinomycetales bacterium]